MTQPGSWLADALLAHAMRVMPATRAEWARAMQAEAEHLPTRERLPFAIGCVRSSYRLSLTEAENMLRAGRLAIILGLCGAAALCLHTAAIIRPHEASAMIVLLALICLTSAAAFARWGFDRLPMLAGAGFAAGLVAMLALGDPAALFTGEGPSGAFYRAILLEQAIAWAALFGLAHLLLALEAKRRPAG
jgi:hypothetical protein